MNLLIGIFHRVRAGSQMAADITYVSLTMGWLYVAAVLTYVAEDRWLADG